MRLSRRAPRGNRRFAALLGTAALVAGLLAGCTDDEPKEEPTPTIPTKLTFAVFGPEAELEAYREVVDSWNRDNPAKEVTLVSVDSREEQRQKLESGEAVPDVFLVTRPDLGYVLDAELTQPVGDLLDQSERDVDFSDGYLIDAVRAFSQNNDLQCMPYGYSPMVMYYNTDLIDFERMARRELNVPSRPGGWSFDEFSDAAHFASRPATGSAGVYIDPTLRGLAPFIHSGGGQVFNDSDDPTSLSFSDGDTREALATTLALLRDPRVALSDKQLARQSPLAWFKDGKLGMIAGFRGLIPELRKVPGLNFDLMAMPRLGDARTVGDVTGLCMSKAVPDPEAAADFIYYLSSDEAVGKVAEAGYLVPANLKVLASDEFLQPGQMPATTSVFSASIRGIVLLPMLDVYPELTAAVGGDLRRLFSVGVLDLVTGDGADRRRLDPGAGPGVRHRVA